MRTGVVTLNSGQLAWLARAKAAVYVDCEAEQTPPRFDGDPAALIAQAEGAAREKLQVQLRNKVKKCASCGKPNAFTLDRCNGCSNDLTAVEVSHTNNIFASFLLGIARGPFPFTISIRRQTPHFLVLDDLLSLTRVHLNVLPAAAYIPDWLTLLRDPARGLELVDAMFEECWTVVAEVFYPKHADHLFAGSPALEEIRSHVVAGFNYPPSQYQLHMQFMVPPFLPFQWLACKKGVHFTPKRFFPVEYVRAVLQCPSQFEWKDGSSTVEELFEFYRAKHGVDYDKIHADACQRYYASHEKLANWDPAHFEGVVVDGEKKLLPLRDGGKVDEAAVEEIESADKIAADDKMKLQNYGRPYNAESGKPSGTYYKYAKETLDFF